MVNDSTRLVGGKHVLRSVDHLTAGTSTVLYADRGRNCELYTEAVRLSNGRAKFQHRRTILTRTAAKPGLTDFIALSIIPLSSGHGVL